MKQLTFYSLAEKTPADGETILYVDTNHFYSTYEFRCGKVEYSWEEIDEEGHSTGSSIVYDSSETQPENTTLVMAIDGFILEPDVLWAPVDEVESTLFGGDAHE